MFNAKQTQNKMTFDYIGVFNFSKISMIKVDIIRGNNSTWK